MRTTITINDQLVHEAWRLVRPRTKRELIERSLQELIRHEHLKRLAHHVGRVPTIGLTGFLHLRRRG